MQLTCRLRRLAVLIIALGTLATTASSAAAQAGDAVDDVPGAPRVIVLSDIGNEPDDQMSFTRFLLYSDHLDIEGLVATTSTWQRTAVRPDIMNTVIDHYAQVQPNLLEHDPGFASPATLRSLVTSGQPGYGLAATGTDKMTPGAQQIIDAADKADDRPLWVSVWGGANTLAQALLHVRETRSPAEVDAFVARLRVYSISDQDDAGPWIRREFPGLSYIVKPSTPNGEEYYTATWTGIAGDRFYLNGDGADFTTVSNEWLDENIRSKGPLGAAYPQYAFIMEGDTPAFLNLIDNGLAGLAPGHPVHGADRHRARDPRRDRQRVAEAHVLPARDARSPCLRQRCHRARRSHTAPRSPPPLSVLDRAPRRGARGAGRPCRVTSLTARARNADASAISGR